MANPKKVLGVTELGTLAVQAVGAFDPYAGDTYLPSPRAFAAVWALWGILGGLAELGGEWARWAANLSVLVFVTALVFGRGSRKVLATLERIAGTGPAGRSSSSGPGPVSTLVQDAMNLTRPGTARGASSAGAAAREAAGAPPVRPLGRR